MKWLIIIIIFIINKYCVDGVKCCYSYHYRQHKGKQNSRINLVISSKRGILLWWENINYKFVWGELLKKTVGSLRPEVRKRLRAAYCAHHIVWLWQLNVRNLRAELGLAIETWPAWFCCFQENTGITQLNTTPLFPCPSPPMSFITIPIWSTSFGSTKIQ
jgi:hypothetical protein